MAIEHRVRTASKLLAGLSAHTTGWTQTQLARVRLFQRFDRALKREMRRRKVEAAKAAVERVEGSPDVARDYSSELTLRTGVSILLSLYAPPPLLLLDLFFLFLPIRFRRLV